MLILRMDRQSIEAVLPVMRQIVLLVFESDSFVLREPALLRYSPRIDESPERLTVVIVAPVKGVIVGKWDDRWQTLVFEMTDLECQLAHGDWPFLANRIVPYNPAPNGNITRALWELLGVVAPTLAPLQIVRPPVNQPGQRELRSITFDDE